MNLQQYKYLSLGLAALLIVVACFSVGLLVQFHGSGPGVSDVAPVPPVVDAVAAVPAPAAPADPVPPAAPIAAVPPAAPTRAARGTTRPATSMPAVAVIPLPFVPARTDANGLAWDKVEEGSIVAVEGDLFHVTGKTSASNEWRWNGVITADEFPDGDFVFSADVKINQPRITQNYTFFLRVSTDAGTEMGVLIRPNNYAVMAVSRSVQSFGRAIENSPMVHHLTMQYSSATTTLSSKIGNVGLGPTRGALVGKRRFSMLIGVNLPNATIDVELQNQKIVVGPEATAIVAPPRLTPPVRPSTVTTTNPAAIPSTFPAQIADLKKTSTHNVAQKTLLGLRSGLASDDAAFVSAVGDYLAVEWVYETDQTIQRFLETHPDHQKALLLRAIVVRSRHDVASSRPLFEAVVKAGKGSVEGRCAAYMLDIDAGRHATSGYLALRDLAGLQLNDVQLQWLLGIAAERLNRTNEGHAQLTLVMVTGLPPLRAKYLFDDSYGWLEMFRIGDRVIRDRQAIVAAMPAAWSYQGLARSLTSLHRETEAEAACAKAVELEPKNAAVWVDWAESLIRLRRFPEAIAKCQKALEVDPKSVEAAAIYGFALENSNRAADAMVQYRKSAGIKNQPEALLPQNNILALAPAAARVELIKYLSQGKQADAENIAALLAQKHPNDEAVQFANAVLVRSRFDVQGALPLFRRVAQQTPDSFRGQCAKLMVAIDTNNNAQLRFDDLCDLAREHPADPFVVWTAALACRTLKCNLEGVEFYELLFRQMSIGPSMLHQTYANILSELSWHERALAHRKMAVNLEPAVWSIDGLAITLNGLQFHEASNAAHQSVDKAAPENRQYLLNWEYQLRCWGRYQEAIDKCQRMLALNPKDAEAHIVWGYNLDALGKSAEAATHYEAARNVVPK